MAPLTPRKPQLAHCMRPWRMGWAAVPKNEWVEGVQEQFGVVKVSVADVRVEHQVKIADFTKWLERPGRTPRDVSQRHKIRAILGMSAPR
jgi:hypothetical protein